MGEYTDANRQSALANVYLTARTLHELRALTAEVEGLHRSAMVLAVESGLSKAIVAEASGLTGGRVSQVVNGSREAITKNALRKRINQVTEFPQDALRKHAATFTGKMTFPPYPRRRQVEAVTIQAQIACAGGICGHCDQCVARREQGGQ